jgi:3-oxoacyl-[acyl-carrier-protein] synthase-3
MRSDGSGGELLGIPAGGSRYPVTAETLARKMHTIHMNGREVFRFATRVMVTATKEAAARSGLRLSDISLIIPHQANLRIIETAARGLHMPMEKFVVNIGEYGNTSTASIPIAACEAVRDGRIRPGDNLIMVGFGAGLTWGALALQWVEPLRPVTTATPAAVGPDRAGPHPLLLPARLASHRRVCSGADEPAPPPEAGDLRASRPPCPAGRRRWWRCSSSSSGRPPGSW